MSMEKNSSPSKSVGRVRPQSYIELNSNDQEYQPPKRISVVDGKDQAKSSMFIEVLDIAENMCRECNKRVYEMEKIVADQVIYHKSCFKCTHCKRLLSLSIYASMDGVPYCKPHFLEIFKSKGHYEALNDENPLSKKVEEEDDESKPKRPPPTLPAVKNVKMMFEVTNDPTSNRSSKILSQECLSPKKSKWEKQAVPIPVPVNRIVEDEVDSNDKDGGILPPVDITKNLVAKFRVIQQGGSEEPTQDPPRKPVRKITPPRELFPEELKRENLVDQSTEAENRDVVRHDDKLPVENELPPPAITKNLLAKFQTMEFTKVESTVDQPKNGIPESKLSFGEDCVDSGVFENEPVVNADIVKETDEGSQQELPEEGFTRSLVAQWRILETELGGSKSQTPKKSRSPSVASSSSRQKPSLSCSQSSSSLQAQEDFVDRSDDAEKVQAQLPPPDITKNLLSKFKMLQSETQTSVVPQPQKKQFKWDVKELKPVNFPGLIISQEKTQEELNEMEKLSINGDTNQDTTKEKETSELPPPNFTKAMLSKFRDIENS